MATVTYETTTCTRCGGTGEFSYCQRYGTMCFKCKGKGKTLTKRGQAAANFAESILRVPVHEAIGCLVWADSWGCRVKGVVVEVTKEGDADRTFHFQKRDGSFHDVSYGGANINVRKLATAEDIALIAEYQECLTKAGTPSKKSRFYKEQA